MPSRSSKIEKKYIQLREKLWPDLSEEALWHRKTYDGFISVPRTMPIIIGIIDDLTKGKPAGRTYFALWCKVYDAMYINLQNVDELAYHSGFSGQRAVRTWQERMTLLKDLGFILTAAGTRGEISHTVILNPHFVVRKLKNEGRSGLTEAAFNSLVERANEVGAKDMDIVIPDFSKTAKEEADNEFPS